MEKISKVIQHLSQIDVSGYLDKKGKFYYLQWAKAWEFVLEVDPEATYSITKFPNAVSVSTVDKDGLTTTTQRELATPYLETKTGFYVEVVVTIAGKEHKELYPVLDYNNKPVANPNTFDINTSCKRAMVKALAHFGLGLSIFYGEINRLSNPQVGRQEGNQLNGSPQKIGKGGSLNVS